MLSSLVLGVVLLFAPPATKAPPTIAPDSVAALALDIKGSSINTKLLRQNFADTLVKELVKPPVQGDSLNNLVSFYGCDNKDGACIIKVARALKVRFVIGGEASYNKATKDISLSLLLYDATVDKILSKASGTLTGPEDTSAMLVVINTLLSNDVAAPLRVRKSTKDEVPVALQDSVKPVDTAPTGNPKRWLLIPLSLEAASALTFVVAAAPSVVVRQVQRGAASPDDISQEDRALAQTRKEKLAPFAITCDVLGAAALVTAPIAIWRYKKDKKAQEEAKAAEAAPAPAPAK